jgi:hypothetical protein
MYPDVEVLRTGQRMGETQAAPPSALGHITPAPLIIPVMPQVEVRVVTVEIRDAASNELVTAIEILSPVNKREPGLTQYRQKRQRLYSAGVHLLELDLLRRGARPVAHPRIPAAPYLVMLTRARSPTSEVWPLQLQDALPIVPVPLRPPDGDATLDLPAALAAIYDEAAYDLSIDYREPPPPPALSEAEAAWARVLLTSDSSGREA